MVSKTIIDADLEENELRKHGWSSHKSPRARHRALVKAVQEDGPLVIFRRLNLLWIYNSRPDSGSPGGRRPKNHTGRVAYADRNWVGRQYDVSREPGFQFGA
jgi:hypothetical protein